MPIRPIAPDAGDLRSEATRGADWTYEVKWDGYRTSAIKDGEIVAVDENGRPSFQALHHQSAHTLVQYAFDVLHLDGRQPLKTPLDERR